METIPYDRLREFLGVTADLTTLDPDLRVQKIKDELVPAENGSFEGIMSNIEKPFQKLERAVIYEDREKHVCIVSVSEITQEECEGHLKGNPMIPLIFTVWRGALTGRLLAASFAGKDKIVPEVEEYGGGRPLISQKTFKYLNPPQKLLCMARIESAEERSLNTVDYKFWVAAEDQFIPLGTHSSIRFSLIPRELHSKWLHPKQFLGK